MNKKMFFFSANNIDIRPSSIEHAYLAILNGDFNSALEVLKNIDSPRSKWGVILIQILQGHIIHAPTFFQIRNFFEIDLDFLIKNEKIDYVEMLLGSLDFLAQINQEAYKFAARVMFENNFYNAAQKYMEKSKKYFYNDPELHFMLAKLYIELKNFKQADYYIDECIRILPNYFPAKKLKEENAQNLHNN